MRKQKTPNLTVSFYDGKMEYAFDCLPQKCKFVGYYLNPPEEGDDCAHYQGGCSCQHARLAALKLVKDEIEKEIGTYPVEEGQQLLQPDKS